MAARQEVALISGVFAALLAACGSQLPSATPGTSKIVVRPGQSIQAAVDQARPGDTILVEPGVYREAVHITKSRVSLLGVLDGQSVVLENPHGISNGIVIGGLDDCFHRVGGNEVAGFEVKGFKISGIAVECADDVRLDNDLVENNLMGFELREAARTTLDGDTAVHNTAGIFELIMPGDALERSESNTLSDNLVRDNERPNQCPKPGETVCLIAPGVGIAVVGGAHNANLRNRVLDNSSFGIAVLDVCSAFEIPASRCARLGFDPLARFTRTERNVALRNRVDLLWSANGHGNCWLDNHATTKSPPSLPRCRRA